MGARDGPRPKLTWPKAVRVKGRPRTGKDTTPADGEIPKWVIQALIDLGGGRSVTREHHTAIDITEWLDVLIYAPPATYDLRFCYYVGRSVRHTGVCWGPVLLVGFDEHEPREGRINPGEWPCIHLEGC